MTDTGQPEVLSIDGNEVAVTHPQKLYFSRDVKLTKLDLVRYYLAVAPGALNGISDRPIVLKRFVNGAEAEPFYQKRAPADHPSFLRTVTLSFPSGRTAEELVVDNAAGLAWIVNLGCIELHPHAVRASDLAHPDELRIDLDPGPGVPWTDVRAVSLEVKAVLEEARLIGWVKTSGSRGMHVNVRIHQRWDFTEVRRAALALAREVERRVPALASSKWWKEERHGVFLDYNQNAKDRTTASAYSVRPLPDARVSAPLAWDEVMTCDPADFTVLTMPGRFARFGDPHAAMDQHAGSLEGLLELAARDEAQGIGDAPWPPHFAKQAGEGKRVQPSKAKPSRTANAEKPFSDQLGEGFGAKRFRKRAVGADAQASKDVPSKVPKKRTPKYPLITVANSPDKSAAEAGLDRWKQRHPEAAGHLAVDDVLVDRMRGASAIWYRIRVNLRHVPEDQLPPQETPDPDDDPTRPA
ncbi:MAG TPA: DNA polymerase domain-containing protein [Acidobacteriaceae bacterium]|jgi:DNA ligase D-like protein (predicted polymerase)|nr:DNA polymerase domain-containing protein [Acidobacteriaceae bacterium]